ncbi:restriction endonuclease subunit S [Thermococcus sp.]
MTRIPSKARLIREIPEDWEVVKIKDVVDIKQGEYIGTRNLKSEGYPVYGANGIIGYFTRFHYIDPQVVVACRGSTSGIVNITKEKAFISNNAMVLLPKSDKILKNFLYYIMSYEYITGKIKRIISGMGIPQIIKRDLEKYKIPLPPLPEQRKIAKILRTVDEAIEKTDLAIGRTERLKKGLMQRLLTRGIKHERFKKTELGEIPEEWRVVRLGDYIEILSGTAPSKLKFTENGEVLYLKVNDLNNSPKYISTAELKFNPSENSNLKIRIYPPKTIVFPKRGAAIFTNKIRILTRAAYSDTNIMGLVVQSSELEVEFLYYYLSNLRLNTLLENAGIPQINNKHIKPLKIPLPPLPEQKQIAEILSTVDRKLELLRKRRERLERIKKCLMKDLLTGRRRVRVE